MNASVKCREDTVLVNPDAFIQQASPARQFRPRTDTYARYVRRCELDRRQPDQFLDWLRQQLEFLSHAERDEREELARLGV